MSSRTIATSGKARLDGALSACAVHLAVSKSESRLGSLIQYCTATAVLQEPTTTDQLTKGTKTFVTTAMAALRLQGLNRA
jgi:hypothetical protein